MPSLHSPSLETTVVVSPRVLDPKLIISLTEFQAEKSYTHEHDETDHPISNLRFTFGALSLYFIIMRIKNVFSTPVILGLASFALFSSFLPHSYILDGFEYANAVENNDPNLLSYYHPHHLFYRPLLSGIYEIASLFGYSGGSIIIIQMVSSLAGALVVAAFFSIAFSYLGSYKLALTASLFLTGSFGFWHLSTQTDPYVISMALLAWSLYFLVIYLKKPHKSISFIIGVLFYFALMISQSNVIFALIFIYISMINRRDYRLLSYSIVLPGLLSIVTYYIVGTFFKKLDSFKELILWMTTFAHSGYNWTLGIKASVIGLFESIGIALAGGQSLLEYKLGAHGIFNTIGIAANLLSLLFALAAVLWLGVSLRKLIFKPDKTTRLLLLMLIIYPAFFTWWATGQYKLWVILLIPFWLLIFKSMAMTRIPVNPRRSGLYLIITVCIWNSSNFIGNTLPKSLHKPVVYSQVIAIDSFLRELDRIIFDDFIKTGEHPELLCETFLPQYIPYYLGSKTIRTSTLLNSPERFYSQIESSMNKGSNVYSYSSLEDLRNSYSARENCFEKIEFELLKRYEFIPITGYKEATDIVHHERTLSDAEMRDKILWKLKRRAHPSGEN